MYPALTICLSSPCFKIHRRIYSLLVALSCTNCCSSAPVRFVFYHAPCVALPIFLLGCPKRRLRPTWRKRLSSKKAVFFSIHQLNPPISTRSVVPFLSLAHLHDLDDILSAAWTPSAVSVLGASTFKSKFRFFLDVVH